MPGKSKLAVGDLVRVKCDILNPKCGWGMVTPGDVGTVISVEGKRCTVKFPKDGSWRGLLKELEPVMHEADRALEGVMDMYEHLFNTRRFEDVTFELADGTEGAHRVVLAAASDAFAAMFEQPMQEYQSGKVELRSIKWVTMRVFLRLLYTGRVDPQDWQDESQGRCGSSEDHRNAAAEDKGEEEYEDAVDDDNDSNDHDENDDTEEGEDKDWNNEGGEGTEIGAIDKSKFQNHVEVPLEILCEVAGLAQKYMVNNVLQLAIEALKVRLQKAAVQNNVTVFEEIMAVAISMGLGAVRTAAVQVAKKSKAIWKRYDAKQLRPEVQLELQAVWPPPRPVCKARHVWLA